MLSKQEQVYKILLTSIECTKTCTDIYLSSEKIYSGQYYCNGADADMSNFSVGFYEILYSDLLNGKKLLNEKGKLKNKNYAGDTINSFNTIANITHNAGTRKAERTDKSIWPEYLKEYYNSYHCLANFWLIPTQIGRTNKKLNQYDSIDIFLSQLSKDYSYFQVKYDEYFKNFYDYNEFCAKHFVKLNKTKEEIITNYRNKNNAKLVNDAMSFIKQRAYNISRSSKTNELYNYFQALNLIS